MSGLGFEQSLGQGPPRLVQGHQVAACGQAGALGQADGFESRRGKVGRGLQHLDAILLQQRDEGSGSLAQGHALPPGPLEIPEQRLAFRGGGGHGGEAGGGVPLEAGFQGEQLAVLAPIGQADVARGLESHTHGSLEGGPGIAVPGVEEVEHIAAEVGPAPGIEGPGHALAEGRLPAA